MCFVSDASLYSVLTLYFIYQRVNRTGTFITQVPTKLGIHEAIHLFLGTLGAGRPSLLRILTLISVFGTCMLTASTALGSTQTPVFCSPPSFGTRLLPLFAFPSLSSEAAPACTSSRTSIIFSKNVFFGAGLISQS